MGLESEEGLTVNDLGKLATRALEYQRYIFRRTYAAYYLIWAPAIAFLAYSNPSALVGLTGESGTAVDAVLGLLILALAVIATARIFRRALGTVRLHRALAGEQSRGHAPYFLAWVVALVVVSLAIDAYLPADAQASLYALLVPVPVVLYYTLGLAFPEGRPVEGLLALAAYGSAAILSLALSLMGVDPWVAGWAWGATILVWVGAAFFGLLRAPDEFEALRA